MAGVTVWAVALALLSLLVCPEASMNRKRVLVSLAVLAVLWAVRLIVGPRDVLSWIAGVAVAAALAVTLLPTRKDDTP